LLSTAALLTIALPITFGLLNPTPSRAQSQAATMAQPAQTFETVSIKPDRSADDRANPSKVMFSLEDGSFMARGVTLQFLVKLAYQVQDSQLSVGQDWMNGAKYDVDAKMSNAEVEELRKTPVEQRTGDQAMLRTQGMLQALLRDHFKLALHPETKNLPVYDLVVDASGSKLQESNGPRMMHMDKGELISEGTHLAFLADQLSIRLGRTVVDKTGLKGNYSYTLRWTPDASEEERLSRNGMPSPPAASSPEVSGPPLATAVQEQLGLKLEPRTDAVQVLVIDHAEAPSEN